MVKTFEFYHGAVLTSLIHHSKGPLSIKKFPTLGNASYIIDNKIGIYIKYSHSRMSPWHFTINRHHQDEIIKMKKRLDEVHLVLVCSDDGIVSLNFNELNEVLGGLGKLTGWVTAARNKRKEYTLKGSEGILSYKVSKYAFYKNILS